MKPIYSQLGEVAEFINGAAFKPEDWGDAGTQIIRIQNLTDKSKPFNRTTKKISEKLHVHPGDLLVSWSATLGVFEWQGPDVALLNQHIFRVLPKADKVDKRYLRHSLELALQDMRKHLHGATMLHVNRGEFLSTKLYLPPISEQRRIAAILDQADALRAKRREALAQLEELQQSIFIEMLGPQKAIPTIELGEVSSMKRGPFGGALKKEIFVDEGPMVYEQRNAIQDDCLTGRYFISEEKFQEMSDFSVLPNDIIISCSGTLGKAAIVPYNAPKGIINQALLRVRVDTNLASPVFLKHVIESREIQTKLAGLSRGTGLQNFPPMSEVRSLKIPLPDVKTQKAFEARLQTLDRHRHSTSESATELDSLFKSLQHRAFNGEL
ncbi:MAG: restriction endonuclease subunit S [Oxalobacter sp.]|nr:MAG: restriction endonuclease subunit S [Oxalobacter sp.]